MVSIAIAREARAEARSAPTDLGLAENVIVSLSLACLKLLHQDARLTEAFRPSREPSRREVGTKTAHLMGVSRIVVALFEATVSIPCKMEY